jgi:hypothetical protein
MIMKKDDFRARYGWLDKFKNRFGMRFLTITGEKLSCDVSAVDRFVRKFQEKIEELDLGPEQVHRRRKRSNLEDLVHKIFCPPS